MYYPASDTIAAKWPQWRDAIEKIDQLLHDNAGDQLAYDFICIFVGESSRTVDAIIREYEKLRMVESLVFRACATHPQVFYTPNPESISLYCDLCDHTYDAEQLIEVSVVKIAMAENDLPESRYDNPPRVLISYSHDSSGHADRVLDFANQLREHGIDAWIDQYEPVPKQGWPAWMQQQIERAEYVLCVCTEEYKRRFNDEVETDVGRGVSWEANLIRNAIYNSKATQNTKFVVVQFDQHRPSSVPAPLQGYTVFPLKSFQLDDSKYISLYRHLTNQPEVETPVIGQIVNLQPRDRKSEGAPEKISVMEALANPQVLPVTDRAIVESEFLDLAEQHRRLCARWNQIKINTEWELIEEASRSKRDGIQKFIDLANSKIREFCNGTNNKGPSEVSDSEKMANQDDELCKELREQLKKIRIKRAKAYDPTSQLTLDNLIEEKEAEIAQHCSDPK